MRLLDVTISDTMEKTLRNYLYEHMPLTQAMGIEVVVASTERLVLSAPLANNINHKGTAFGGSLHAAGTLACWSLLWVNVKAMSSDPIEIVVAQSNATYHAPVDRDFRVDCMKPDGAVWDRFKRGFDTKRKAPIKLVATIYNCHTLAVTYEATFMTLRPT